MNCDRCTKEGTIVLPYGPHRFCIEHFAYFFEHRVRTTTRVHELFDEGEKIAIAVSGGKDSVVALNLMKTILPRNEIVGISIDEGIDGYRNLAIEKAIENYKALDVPYKIVKVKEKIGSSMQEVVQKTHENQWKENSCTFCGVFRRKYINEAARELGADKLVTGHNLDDEAQSVCMNLFTNQTERMLRTGPKISYTKVHGWVPRVKPLYFSPEEEVELFAQVKNYPHYSDKCCPFSHGADRNIYRMMIDQLEMKKPGAKNGLIQAFLELKEKTKVDASVENEHVHACERCGDLTAQPLCQACKYEERIRNTPMKNAAMNPLQINSLGKNKFPSNRLPILP